MASYGYTFNSGDGVTPPRLNDARTVSEIVNADIKSDAAIAGTKIAPAFGAQDITVSTANRSITNTGNFALSFGTNNTERVRIANDGNVGIGTTTPGALLTINKASGASDIRLAVGGTLYGTLYASSSDATLNSVTAIPLVFGTNNTERMRIDASGNVLISTTNEDPAANNISTAIALRADGRISARGTDNFATAVFARGGTDGSVVDFLKTTTLVGSISVTTTATAFNTSSDYRLKENAAPLTGGLSTVSQLNPVSFKWKSDGSTGYGFIAHELQAVAPEAVTGEKDAVDAEGKPQYQGVDASKLVPYLVAAVQELSARVEALEAAQ